MVDVEVGQQHVVDVLGPHAGGRQAVEKGRVEMVEHSHRAGLPVARARVDQNGATRGLDEPAVITESDFLSQLVEAERYQVLREEQR